MMYWFGFSMGYVVSQCVSSELVAITGVMTALIFSAAFSGTSPTIAEVHGFPNALGNLWLFSGPRWTLEAFYVNAVSYYQYIPAGSSYGGAPYADLQAQLHTYGYKLNHFNKVMMDG